MKNPFFIERNISESSSEYFLRNNWKKMNINTVRYILLQYLLCWAMVAGAAQEISVTSYGALGNGVSNDTNAFKQAIAAASSQASGAKIRIPAGQYIITEELLIQKNGVHLVGDGIYATKIIFNPKVEGSLFKFTKGQQVIYNNSIRDLALTTRDTFLKKTGISIFDSSQMTVQNILIYGFYGGESIGLNTFGREQLSVTNMYCYADIPIKISKNPNTNGWLSGDHFHFLNLSLFASKSPLQSSPWANVLVDDQVNITNMVFDGHQAWVGGQYGFYWKQNATPSGFSLSNNLVFQNVRTEQGPPDGVDGYSFLIDHNDASINLRGLEISNVYLDSRKRGIFLRNIDSVELVNSSGITVTEALNVNNVRSLRLQDFLTSKATPYFALSDSSGYMRLIDALANIPGFPNPHTATYQYQKAGLEYQSKPIRLMEASEWAWSGILGSGKTTWLPVNSSQAVEIAMINLAASNPQAGILESCSFVAAPVLPTPQNPTGNVNGIVLVSGTPGCSNANLPGAISLTASGFGQTSPLQAVGLYNRLGLDAKVVIRVTYMRSSDM